MKRFFPFLVLLAAAACQPAAPVTPTGIPVAMETAVISSSTRTQTPPAVPTETALPPVYVPALCTLMGREVRSDVPAGHPVILVWGWSAATEEQVKDYIRAGTVIVTFDGAELKGEQMGGIPYDETAKLYKAVWAADIGIIKLGLHTITYSLIFSEKIFDGFDYYGPGTKNEKQEDRCEIEVK